MAIALRVGIVVCGLMVGSVPLPVGAEIVVHETFSDGDITDDQPGNWSLHCHMRECSDPVNEASFEVVDGEFAADFNTFAMWRLVSVRGQAIEPNDTWSIRARIEPTRVDAIGSLFVGVGLDTYYWAAGWASDPGMTDVSLGLLYDSGESPDTIPFYDEWVVQLDVYPDYLEAFAWLVNDPGRVIRGNWSRDSHTTEPGLPVFWGNGSDKASFREVLVSTTPLGPGGDFNRDDAIDVADLDLLSRAIRAGEHDPRYNLTSDLTVDQADLQAWVQFVQRTYLGDANLDGEFNSGDLVAVFGAGEYEDQVADNSTWADGDWNADGEFDSSDLVAAFTDGGYEAGLRSTAAVPEPTTGVLLATLIPLFAVWRHDRLRQLFKPTVAYFTLRTCEPNTDNLTTR